MPTITLQNTETGETKIFKVGYGANLRQSIIFHEGEIYKGANKFLNCRGLGFCGKCLVEITPIENSGNHTLFEKLHQIPANQRMGCRAKVTADITVKGAFKD